MTSPVSQVVVYEQVKYGPGMAKIRTIVPYEGTVKQPAQANAETDGSMQMHMEHSVHPKTIRWAWVATRTTSASC